MALIITSFVMRVSLKNGSKPASNNSQPSVRLKSGLIPECGAVIKNLKVVFDLLNYFDVLILFALPTWMQVAESFATKKILRLMTMTQILFGK